jgi:hypothetical protein
MLMRIYALFVLSAICLLAACGSGLPGSSSLAATINPPNPTLAAGATVALTGNDTGFTQTPLPQWQMQESTSVANQHCGFLVTSTSQANFTNCPMGYVTYDPNKFPSTATYYAPPTPGTYHVQFIATQFSTFDHVSTTATAPVTVAP